MPMSGRFYWARHYPFAVGFPICFFPMRNALNSRSVMYRGVCASWAQHHHPVAAGEIPDNALSHGRREKTVRGKDRLNRRRLLAADLDNHRTSRREHPPDPSGDAAKGGKPVIAAIERHQRIVIPHPDFKTTDGAAANIGRNSTPRDRSGPRPRPASRPQRIPPARRPRGGAHCRPRPPVPRR